MEKFSAVSKMCSHSVLQKYGEIFKCQKCGKEIDKKTALDLFVAKINAKNAPYGGENRRVVAK